MTSHATGWQLPTVEDTLQSAREKVSTSRLSLVVWLQRRSCSAWSRRVNCLQRSRWRKPTLRTTTGSTSPPTSFSTSYRRCYAMIWYDVVCSADARKGLVHKNWRFPLFYQALVLNGDVIFFPLISIVWHVTCQVFYSNNAAREAFVEMCESEYVQKVTFDSYLYKKVRQTDRQTDVLLFTIVRLVSTRTRWPIGLYTYTWLRLWASERSIFPFLD